MIFVVKGQFTKVFLAAMLVLCFGNIAQPASPRVIGNVGGARR